MCGLGRTEEKGRETGRILLPRGVEESGPSQGRPEPSTLCTTWSLIGLSWANHRTSHIGLSWASHSSFWVSLLLDLLCFFFLASKSCVLGNTSGGRGRGVRQDGCLQHAMVVGGYKDLVVRATSLCTMLAQDYGSSE